MAWRKKSGVLKDVWKSAVIYEFKEGGVKHPLQLKDGLKEGYITVSYKNFSNIVNQFVQNEGINNLSINANPEFFPNGSVYLKQSSKFDVDVDFSFDISNDHYNKIINSLANTLENRHYGRDKRIIVEIPHSIRVDGKIYNFKEHIWNNNDIYKKDLHMPDEILKRKKSKIKNCNVDLTKDKNFDKELETVGKVAEAVAKEAENLGYEDVAVKQMKNDKEEVVGVQFCVPTVPLYETKEELLEELHKQENLKIIDSIKDTQKGILNANKNEGKLSGWYVIYKDQSRHREKDLFGYVGDNLLFFDGLEDIVFDEEYTRPTTELILSGLNVLGNAAKGAYNYTGVPKFFSSINLVKAIREEGKRAKERESERQKIIYNAMKKSGFVKPEKNKGSEFDRCVIILNEDAVGQEAVATGEQK